MAKNFENGNTQMVRTTMAIPIDIGGGQVAKINLPPGATLAGPVKVLTLPNQQTIAHVTVMAPPGVVEKYVAQAAADSEAAGSDVATPKALSTAPADVPPELTPAPVHSTSPTKATPTDARPAASPSSPPASPAPLTQPVPKLTAKPTPVPVNLFDKLNSKPIINSVPEKAGNKTGPRAKIISSSDDDDIPLSHLSSQKPETKKTSISKKPLSKKTPSDKSIDKQTSEKKPQTGFGVFLEEKRAELFQKNPRISEKELNKEAKHLWDNLEVSKKNHFIRNSDAYKLKKGIITVERLLKNDKKATKVSKHVTSPTTEKNSSIHSQSKSQALSKKQEDHESNYRHPKRNIKRKFFDVDEDYDLEDSDWTMPAPEVKIEQAEQTPLTTTLPPLKFKKKSKQVLANDGNNSLPKHPKVDKMAVNDDIDLPSIMDIEDKPSDPPPISHKKSEALKNNIIKESTPPPPLRKIESAVAPPVERKTNLKLICLHEGCYEEASTESTRGKYWCSDKCCILYSKVIFNAWLGARRANMID